MRTIAILTILLLLTVQSATAVWDASSMIEEVAEGDIVALGDNIQVRVLEVGDVEEVVFIQVERRGTVIGSGAVTKDNPYVIDDILYVDMKGFANYQEGSNVARIQIFQWVDGEFVGLHFPEKMNLKSLYDVFALVENTGSKTGTFTIELTQAGEYIKRADRYEDELGNLIPRLVDVQRPIKEALLAPGEVEKVVYERISPVRRQPSRTNDLHRQGDMLFNLYYEGQLLDQLLLKNVELTTGQSGYIQDIRMPTTFRRDNPQEIELDVLNAGQAFGGIERSKFNLRLDNKDFYFLGSNREYKTTELQVSPDLVRGDLPAYIAKTWKVRLSTFAPAGDYNLHFILEHNKEVMDRFTVPVSIRSGANTRVTAMRMPERVDMGEEFEVEVDVFNAGLGRDVVVVLEGDMVEEVPEKYLQMGPEEATTVKFTLPATGMGIERLDAKVLVRELEEKGKNFDPYANGGYEVHSKASTTYVYVPGMDEGPMAREPQESVPPAPVAPTLPAGTDYTPPATPEPVVEEMPEWNITQGMPILVVALVILIILIAVKVLFYYAE